MIPFSVVISALGFKKNSKVSNDIYSEIVDRKRRVHWKKVVNTGNLFEKKKKLEFVNFLKSAIFSIQKISRCLNLTCILQERTQQ